MHIHVFNQQSILSVSKPSVRRVVRSVLSLEKKNYDEVSIYFVEEVFICQLHKDHFNDPSPTDCISFPFDDEDDLTGYRILGEVFVNPNAALEYTNNEGGDPYEELTLYVVHGLLHLLGYDDLEESACQKMRLAETRHMQTLKELGLYTHRSSK